MRPTTPERQRLRRGIVASLGILIVLSLLPVLSTSRGISSPAGAVLPTQLSVNGVLTVGGAISSPSGTYKAVMAWDGNLHVENMATSAEVWSTAISPAPGSSAYLILQGDGNLGLYRSPGNPAWWTSTAPEPGDHLIVTDAGQLQIISIGGLLLWTNAPNGVDTRGTRTNNRTSILGWTQSMTPSMRLYSLDLAYSAGINASCQVAVTRSSDHAVVWTSPNAPLVSGCPQGNLILQGDGNFVLYSTAGHPAWATNKLPYPYDRVSMNSDGTLAQYWYQIYGPLLWTSTVSSSPTPTTTTTPPTTTTTTTTPPSPASSIGTSLKYLLTMLPTQQLTSPDGLHRVVINASCQLTVAQTTGAHAVTWTSSNAPVAGGCPSGYLSVDGDGNLALHSTPTTKLWATGTTPDAFDQAVLTNDGVLGVYSMGGVPLWFSATGPTGNTNDSLALGNSLWGGQFIFKVNGDSIFKAEMQVTGNFAAYQDTGAVRKYLWQTNTGNTANAGGFLNISRADSDIRVVGGSGGVQWHSGTAGMSGSRMTVLSSGTVVYYGATGLLWTTAHVPVNVGVYAYPEPQTNAFDDGWPFASLTGALGSSGYPWVGSGSDISVGAAMQATGRTGAPWLSFWTVSGAGCGANGLTYLAIGKRAGQVVAQRIDSYAASGVSVKPSYVIYDPEGYPDNHSGLDCNLGSPQPGDIANWSYMLAGWAQGLASVDPSLRPAFYATQGEYLAYNLSSSYAAFLAVAFGSSADPSYPLSNPIPISGAIPYGPAAVAASNIKGVIAFYAGVPFSTQCSWVSVAAQVIANWGAQFNTLQFDPGMRCPA